MTIKSLNAATLSVWKWELGQLERFSGVIYWDFKSCIFPVDWLAGH